jgi:hypothetical protein
MFAKVDVNGERGSTAVQIPEGREAGAARQRSDQVELHQVPGRPGRQRSSKRYAPNDTPSRIAKDIEKAL